jgi:hypothetical protein
MRRDASVIRFFESHRWLLSDPRFAKEAKLRLAVAKRSVAATNASAERVRAELARNEAAAARRTVERKELRILASLRSPERAICHVFGSHCREALQVAQCESGYRASAQNGQYLGIFQMGSNEREMFGHGASPLAQAKAAYRYFVLSGRDWSPWSCKPSS